MSLDVVVFKAIDYMYDLLQNRPEMMARYKDVKVEKDIVYDETFKDVCTLDTYCDKKEDGTKYPVVFEIHGGGFVAGDKKYRRLISRWFAKETGAFVVTMNYGLGPKYLFPDPVKHLVNAVNWVYDNAEKYNLDLSKFIVTGDSAGGYYAAELCALQDSIEMQKKLECSMKAKFTAIVLNCGIYDIDKALSTKTLFDLAGGVCKDFVGVDVKDLDKYALKDVISPFGYITAKFPKTCIIYAEQDFFCGGQGEMLVEKLNSLGVYNEKYFSTTFGDNHTFPSTWKSKAAVEANALILDFVTRFIANKI